MPKDFILYALFGGHFLYDTEVPDPFVSGRSGGVDQGDRSLIFYFERGRDSGE